MKKSVAISVLALLLSLLFAFSGCDFLFGWIKGDDKEKVRFELEHQDLDTSGTFTLYDDLRFKISYLKTEGYLKWEYELWGYMH